MKGTLKYALLTLVATLLALTSLALTESHTANGFTVTWSTYADGIVHKEYLVEIQNLDPAAARDFDLNIIISNTSFPLSKLDNVEIYEWKAIDTEMPVYITQLVQKNCTYYDGEDNYTYDCSYNATVQNGTETKMMCQWKPTKMALIDQTDKVTADYGLINIPKYESKAKTDDFNVTETINGTKIFKLSFDIPIGKNGYGYGSSGMVGIIDELSGELYHPWWNTSYSTVYHINITNTNATATLPDGYTVNLTFNHTIALSGGKCSQGDGDDIRIVYKNTTELDRHNITAWNLTATILEFRTQENITANGYDDINYTIYCGSATAVNPPASKDNIYWDYLDFQDGAIDTLSEWIASPVDGGTTLSFVNSTDKYKSISQIHYRAASSDSWFGMNLNRSRDNLQDIWIEYDFMFNSTSTTSETRITGVSPKNESHCGMGSKYSNAFTKMFYCELVGNNQIGHINMTMNIENSLWYRIRQQVNGRLWRVCYANETSLEAWKGCISFYDTANTVGYTGNIMINLAGYDQSYDNFMMDNLIVRKWYSAEPTLAVVSSEQTSSPDTTLPDIVVAEPTNTTYNLPETNLTYNVDISFTASDDVAIDKCYREINGTNTTSCANTTVAFQKGQHYFKVWANDSSGNMNSSDAIYFSVDDVTEPRLSVSQPTNTTYNLPETNMSYGVSINMMAYDAVKIDTCIKEVNGTNTSGCGNTTLLFQKGQHYIKLWANDSSGNMNSTTALYFSVDDVTEPRLSVSHPTNTTYNLSYANLSYGVSVGFTSWDAVGVDKCFREINGTNTTSCANTTTLFQKGQHYVKIWSNDTSGNMNSTAATYFSVDDISAPNITLHNVSNTTYTYNTSMPVNYTIYEAVKVDKCWFNIDMGANTTLTGCINATFNASSGASHTLYVYSNDTSGNMETESVNFSIIDLADPVINLLLPLNVSHNYNTSIALNFTAEDNVAVDQCWYSLNGASNVSIVNCSANTTITGAQGINTIIIYVNDTSNYNGTDTVSFIVDSIAPTITTPSISPDCTVASNTVTVSFTIVEGQTIDTLLCNFTQGTGHQNVWLSPINGTNTYFFTNTSTVSDEYQVKCTVNDTAGNSAYSSTYFAIKETCSAEESGSSGGGSQKVTYTSPPDLVSAELVPDEPEPRCPSGYFLTTKAEGYEGQAVCQREPPFMQTIMALMTGTTGGMPNILLAGLLTLIAAMFVYSSAIKSALKKNTTTTK